MKTNHSVSRGVRLLLWGLVLLFAVLMSLPFLIPHCGFTALFGFIPLLCMERIASLQGVRKVWIYHYSAFVLWNAFTTFWVCNATAGGGLFAIFANAFQMSLIFGIFRSSKKYFKGALPYIFLAVMWIAWERAYFDAEISWPWLVLGNAFAGSLKSIQWYEYTGTLGGSLWIWACNLLVFALMVSLSDGSWAFRFNSKAKAALVSSCVLVLAVPFILSKVIYYGYEEKQDPMEVLIVQPNIDPYQKFQAMPQDSQTAILLDQIEKSIPDRRFSPVPEAGSADSTGHVVPDTGPLLVLAPETFTNDIITNDFTRSRTFRRFVSFLRQYPGTELLFGASSYTYYDQEEAPSHTARKIRDGRWVESHNSAMTVDGDAHAGIFHKSKLVVGVEKTPYPAFFCKVDDMLGGVMGRCVGQDEISLLHCSDIPFGCAVCYESVYGEYFTGYVRKGARFMTVITNDAWWGNTPGYRQHLRYSSLRAIETRRSIARCANTGISAIIDQKGEIHSESPWWEPAVIRGNVNMNDSVTLFVRYGDITGRTCTFIFGLLLLALTVRIVLRRKAGRTF